MGKILLHRVLAMVVLCALAASPAVAAEIEAVKDLQRDGQRVRETGKPLVLLVTASDCAFCEVLKRAEFRHLTDDARFLLREVEVDSGQEAKDFDGSETAHSFLGEKYAVRFTPTVLFLDHRGEPLARPLVGVLTLDYYSYYFDKRLAAATRVLRERLN